MPLTTRITRAISGAEPIPHDRPTRPEDKRRSGERNTGRRPYRRVRARACLAVTFSSRQPLPKKNLVVSFDVFSKVDEDLHVNEDGGPESTSADRQGPESKENLQ